MTSIPASRYSRRSIWVWLLLLAACLVVIARSQFSADLSAFLPRSPSAEQQLLMDQLKDGLASRLILVGIEGATAETRAAISLSMAQQLRHDPQFASINNGEAVSVEQDRAYLFNHRYLLSPAVTPQRFSPDGLQLALTDSLEQLASPAGLLLKQLLPHDPSGEMMQLLEQMESGRRPQLLHGAWASTDGQTALMLVQTHALGSDTDAQKQAIQTLQHAYAAAPALQSSKAAPRLVMTGPGVFSVTARDTIKQQVRLIFVVSSLLIALLLWLVYRSLSALLLGFLPVATGIAAGVAAVSLGFGVVHGITLGFGTALIGEAVDYSIYLFMQAQRGEAERKRWVNQIWPTVRLGVLTSIFGFASLLLSGFPGLAQLGLYSVVGLAAAAAMTRFVLPHLLPAGFQVRDVSRLGASMARLAGRAQAWRWAALGLLVVSSVVLYTQRAHIWTHELAALSPIPAADLALDARLRNGMGAPDARYMIVVTAGQQEQVLQAAEQTAQALQPLLEQGVLAGFETPTRFLPSQASQRARQASLPDAQTLQHNLAIASSGLPVKPSVFAPFRADVAAVRSAPLLQRSDLNGTSMALAVDAMLLAQHGKWSALLPLNAPDGREMEATLVAAALQKLALPAGSHATFIDLKLESNRLYNDYLAQAMLLSLVGVLAILVLLGVVLRSWRRVLAITLPLAAAVLTVTAGLVLFGQSLMLLHLIGLLLVVAIGSNYALFFNQGQDTHLAPNTYASLLVANIATVLGFGLLAFSSVPVLQAMGMTVAPGVILALVFSAVFAARAQP